MASGRVVPLTAEHIALLVTRLRSYGAFSVQTRSVLRLLQTRLNPAPFQIFAAGAEGVDLVTVTVMRPTPGYSVLDVCGLENSACRRQLAGLLQSPELAHLWRGPLRTEYIAEGLGPVFSAAVESYGLKRVLDNYETVRLFVRPEHLPCSPRQDRPGLAIRQLQPRHLSKVWSRWPHSDRLADMTAMLRDGLATGVSAGVFLTEPSETEPGFSLGEPVSWSLMNSYGGHSFGYTEEAYRGRGLQNLAMGELVRRSRERGLPCFGYTTDTNTAQLENLKLNQHWPEHVTKRMCFIPS